MSRRAPLDLGAKFALTAAPFLLLTLLAVASTLWMSWRLEGGATAVDESARLRMQAYRLSLSLALGDPGTLAQQADAFDRRLALLGGDASDRPLLPRDPAMRARLAAVERNWAGIKARLARGPAVLPDLPAAAAALIDDIDALFGVIEARMSHWTALLHLLQTAVLTIIAAGAAALVVAGYRFVLEPVARLKDAIERLQAGDFDARVPHASHDEFGKLAQGFNTLAAQLQSSYRTLEARVADKTAELQQKRERLQALYDMTALIVETTSLEPLANGFAQRMLRVARADGIALRWSDEANERYVLLASHGLPAAMARAEHCLQAGGCRCGDPHAPPGVRVVAVQALAPGGLRHCRQAGFKTVVCVPIRLHQRILGEVDLFFDAHVALSQAERSLLEALAAHLATAMENLRLAGLAREAAVSDERNLLARELHDSIAQSLAFLKIQVQLMREALADGDARQIEATLGEIDAGVRESYGDVRELLVHFRTRANSEQIEPALRMTLRKFEHQSGIGATLRTQGHGLPLAPEVQIQVLHIVQEALSNVRKHSGATRVRVEVRQQPCWRFEVHDDGAGFRPDDSAAERGHVGLRIMAERAERIGARLGVGPAPAGGTSVVLELPATAVAHQS